MARVDRFRLARLGLTQLLGWLGVRTGEVDFREGASHPAMGASERETPGGDPGKPDPRLV
jgi:hypothetical protein